jgi:hypothetical protein
VFSTQAGTPVKTLDQERFQFGSHRLAEGVFGWVAPHGLEFVQSNVVDIDDRALFS